MWTKYLRVSSLHTSTMGTKSPKDWRYRRHLGLTLNTCVPSSWEPQSGTVPTSSKHQPTGSSSRRARNDSLPSCIHSVSAHGFPKYAAVSSIVNENINLRLSFNNFVAKLPNRLKGRQVEIMKYYFAVFAFSADLVCGLKFWRKNKWQIDFGLWIKMGSPHPNLTNEVQSDFVLYKTKAHTIPRTILALSIDRQAIITRAPFFAMYLAVSLPIPLFAPVTMTVFPLKFTFMDDGQGSSRKIIQICRTYVCSEPNRGNFNPKPHEGGDYDCAACQPENNQHAVEKWNSKQHRCYPL